MFSVPGPAGGNLPPDEFLAFVCGCDGIPCKCTEYRELSAWFLGFAYYCRKVLAK